MTGFSSKVSSNPYGNKADLCGASDQNVLNEKKFFLPDNVHLGHWLVPSTSCS